MDNDKEELKYSENFFEKSDALAERIVLPVLEEEVKITKKVIETGRVNLSKTIKETTEFFEVPVSEEKVVVERIAKNEFVDIIPPASRYEGNVMIISVLKEVAVVEKRIMLVEEIHVSTLKTERIETHDVVVRKEEININRTNS